MNPYMLSSLHHWNDWILFPFWQWWNIHIHYLFKYTVYAAFNNLWLSRWGTWVIFTMPWTPYYHLDPIFFVISTSVPLTHHSNYSLLAALVISTFSGNLPIAGTSYKWNHTLFVFLCQPDVTKHDIFSRSFHVVAYFKIQFPLTTEWHSTVCIHHIVFIHSALDGLWKSFHLWSIVKNVTMTFLYRYPGIL